MSDEFEHVELAFRLGSLTPAEIQSILDQIDVELADPNSQASREAAGIGVTVQSLEVQEHPGFVLEAFLIAMAIKFGGGAATAGGTLFFKKVIEPRIIRKRSDGIGERIEPGEPDTKS